jgi:hypothetical protein
MLNLCAQLLRLPVSQLVHTSSSMHIYSHGALVALHTDTKDAHLVGLIVNAETDVGSPWPLTLVDREGRAHTMELRPFEAVVYESVTVAHGRLRSLNGTRVSNMFFHFTLKEWGQVDGLHDVWN